MTQNVINHQMCLNIPMAYNTLFFFCSLGTFSGFTKGWKFLNLLFITVYSILYKKFYISNRFFFSWKKKIINPLWKKNGWEIEFQLSPAVHTHTNGVH